MFSKEDLFEYLNQIDPNSVLIGNNLENISEKFNYKFWNHWKFKFVWKNFNRTWDS